MIRIRFIISALIVGLLSATTAYAKSNVITLKHKNTTQLAVQQSILYALNYRKWNIDSNNDNVITASLKLKKIDSKLTITYDQNHVQIDDKTTKIAYSTDPLVFGQEDHVTYYPWGWINNLVADIKRVYPKMAYKYKDAPNQILLSDSEQIKLEQLTELHREGLLDDAAFAAKKAELIGLAVQ